MEIVVRLRPRRALWVLFSLAVLLSLLSVADDVALRIAGPGARRLQPLLKSDAELSLARWYSTVLFMVSFGTALAVGTRASRSDLAGAGKRRAWVGIAAVFLLLSTAKVTSIKSVVMGLARSTLRMARLSVPRSAAAFVILVVLCLAFLPFLISLERRTRGRLLLAGTVYLGGVVVLDVLTSVVWHVAGGGDTLAYALSSTLEELAEMTGVILMLRALLGHLEWLDQPCKTERNVP